MLFKVSFISKISGSNNKLDIGTFKFGQNQLSRVLWQSVYDLE